jgi:hypothetical protein
VIEEGQDQGRIQVGQVEPFRRLTDVLAGKLQQQTEGIAVRRHRLWTGVPLCDEPFQKERL